jgi:23S rRNA pseudouridine1911/1915/1917 synthase
MDIASEEPAEPRVVYEDEWLVAIDKPARMHSAPGLASGDLCAWAFERFPELRDLRPEAGQGRPDRGEGGLLHRLDYETSGLVLFARNAAAYSSLLDQQERGEFYKEYAALASPSREAQPMGSKPDKASPLGVSPGDWALAREARDGRSLAALLGPAGEGRAAEARRIASSFRSFGPKGGRVACLDPIDAAKPYLSDILGCLPSEALQAGESERLQLRIGLSRGFRHQIRAHLAWIGLPICGDRLYGGLPDGRLRLYALRLAFAHPADGRAFFIGSDGHGSIDVAFEGVAR